MMKFFSLILIAVTVVVIVNANNDDVISIVLLGETGTGKSTLGNTLLGCPKNGPYAFSESAGVDAYTNETIAKEGNFLHHKMRVTDTPGLGEAKLDADSTHLAEMAKKIIADDTLQGIVIVLDFNLPRFEEREKMMFERIVNMYPNAPWYNHVAIVWTHYYSSLPQSMKDERVKREEEVRDKLTRFFGSEIPAEKLELIPHFFLDSIEAREQGSEFQVEVSKIVEWAKNCKRLKEDMPEMRVPDGPPRTEQRVRQEKGIVKSEVYVCGGHKYLLFGPKEKCTKWFQEIINIYEERTIQHMTDGTDDTSEWKEVRRESHFVVI